MGISRLFSVETAKYQKGAAQLQNFVALVGEFQTKFVYCLNSKSMTHTHTHTHTTPVYNTIISLFFEYKKCNLMVFSFKCGVPINL